MNINNNDFEKYIFNKIVEEDNEIKNYIDNYELLKNKIFEKYIIQEYIVNPIEYVTLIVFKNNNIIESITYQYNYNSNKYVKGAISESDRDKITKINLEQQYLDVFKNILSSLEYNGICNFNFKIKDGNLKIFEINPRLGGSLMLKNNKNDLITILNSMIVL